MPSSAEHPSLSPTRSTHVSPPCHPPQSGVSACGRDRPRPAFRGLAAVLLLLGSIALAAPAPALAHYPWIAVSETAGQGAHAFRIRFGHGFPNGDPLAADRLAGIRLVAADGSVEPLTPGHGDGHPLPGDGGDARMIVAEQKPAFWSRTHEGGRRASREEYPGAFSCGESANVMKAVYGRGPGESWRHAQGHALELMPLNDPTALRTGDPLELRVTFHGAPWVGELKATYAGYPGQGDEAYAVSVATDADGVARFVPASEGQWLVRAHAAEDYPDPRVCDRRNHYSTLTFVVD
jgi:uncharacterized GH25 family protein